MMASYIDADLAWDVVEHCRPTMRDNEIKLIFVALGAGDYFHAISASARAAGRRGLPLPPDLRTRLSNWLNLNPGADGQKHIAELLGLNTSPAPDAQHHPPSTPPPQRPCRVR